MQRLLFPAALIALLLTGAIFGFFYAWICSTMWGLDEAPPLVAVEAMQAMNASVRNAVFAPAFFGTPVALVTTAFLARASGHTSAAIAFGTAALVYFGGGLVLTLLVNVPMNEALARAAPATQEDAAAIWEAYSPRWQRFNTIRTLASGVALVLSGIGLRRI